MPYDRHISGQQAWDDLAKDGLGLIVDPVVYRIGQLYLEGEAADNSGDRWKAIEDDVGALIAFFDLVVLHEQLPAFNYVDTFDPGPNLGDPLGEVVNTADDKVIVHVNVEYQMYRQAKLAALNELQHRMADGPFITSATAAAIVEGTNAIQYEWSPHLEQLEPLLHSAQEKRVAQFLLGQLVFSGYAQQTRAPHILAPNRSRLMAAIGLQTTKADRSAEAKIFDELRRRSKEAGTEWRTDQLPWRPTFLPLLVERAQRRKFKTGPDALLADAKEIRESTAVQRYRKLLLEFEQDSDKASDARKELESVAEKVAKSLDSSRTDMRSFRHLAVDVLPAAGAQAAGAVAGGLMAGPAGAAAGAAGGLIADRVVRRSQNRLFGWILEGLTMRSASKILTRATTADFSLRRELTDELRIIWESPRKPA